MHTEFWLGNLCCNGQLEDRERDRRKQFCISWGKRDNI